MAAAIETIPAVTEEETDEGLLTEWMPVPYAQQVFSLVPAAAGVTAGLILARKFASERATHVKTSEVLWASTLSFAASLVVVFMIKTFQSYDDAP